MAFIKGFRCRACDSTLGKWFKGMEGELAYCFLGCHTRTGKIPLEQHECEGLDPEEIRQLVGVEGGNNTAIIERLHTEDAVMSQRRNAAQVLSETGGHVVNVNELSYKELASLKKGETLELPIGGIEPDVFKKVAQGLEEILKEELDGVSSDTIHDNTGPHKGPQDDGSMGEQ